MSQALENFLARLYTDAALRQEFLADPPRVINAVPTLSTPDRTALLAIDRLGLTLAAQSFERKRRKP